MSAAKKKHGVSIAKRKQLLYTRKEKTSDAEEHGVSKTKRKQGEDIKRCYVISCIVCFAAFSLHYHLAITDHVVNLLR